MSAEERRAEAAARQQLHDAAERRGRRLVRMLVGASAWAVAMLFTIAHKNGWWAAGVTAAGVDAGTAELAWTSHWLRSPGGATNPDESMMSE